MMNFISHLLVAIVYSGAFLLCCHEEKRLATVYTLAGAVLLVLTGLCINRNLYMICICWAGLDILLLIYTLAFRRKFKLPSLISIQIVFLLMWIYLRSR